MITCHLTTYLASRNRFFTYIHYVVFGLHEESANFFKGKAKRCFRDWPFVYFSGGFISHLFGDYANINL